MPIPQFLMLLAGFALAHASWSISDLPKGELLCPVAVIEKSGQRQLVRFEAESQEKAIREGKAAMAKFQSEVDAYAFAREGQYKENGRYVDVILVDAWAKGMAKPVNLIQKIKPFSSGKFQIVGEPWVVVNGKQLDGPQAALLVSQLQSGIKQHGAVAPLWATWYVPK